MNAEPTLEIYKANADDPAISDFRWRLRAPNGELLAEGAAGHQKKSYAVKAAERAKELMPLATLEVIA